MILGTQVDIPPEPEPFFCFMPMTDNAERCVMMLRAIRGRMVDIYDWHWFRNSLSFLKLLILEHPNF